jgi:hypothetical protein
MNTQIDTSVTDADMVDSDRARAVDARSGYNMGRIQRSLKNFASVSEALRFLGAAVLLASMSIFLLQGWNEGNDINRYLLLLSQTGLLAASGFALSYGLKETKGARIFFGLALISIPANFTILSALLYSVFQWDGALVTYPEYATWQIGDLANIGITFGGAMLVLIPVTMFCFAIMARRSATTLSLHFLLINSLLLLPIRSSTMVGMVALFATVYALLIAARLIRADGALRTPEGRFALTTLFIPPGIILFRSMYFYQVDSLLIAMLSIAVFLTLRQLSQFPDRKPRLALGLEFVSLPVAMVAAMALTSAAEGIVPWHFLAPVFTITFAILALDIVRRTDSRRLAVLTSGAVSLLTSLSFVFNVTVNNSPMTALMCLLAGTALFLFGHAYEDRFARVAGYVTAFAGAVFGFSAFIEMIAHSSWVDLAIFGAAAIALGSLLDRHGASMKIRMEKWLKRIAGSRRNRGLEAIADQ